MVNQVVTATGVKDAEGKDVSSGALNVVLDSVNSLVYVTNRNAGTITVHDLDGAVRQTIDAGRNPNHVEFDGRGNVYAVNKGGSRDGNTKNDYVQRFSLVAGASPGAAPDSSSAPTSGFTDPGGAAADPTSSSLSNGSSSAPVAVTFGAAAPGGATVAAAANSVPEVDQRGSSLARTGTSIGVGVVAAGLLLGGALLMRVRHCA